MSNLHYPGGAARYNFLLQREKHCLSCTDYFVGKTTPAAPLSRKKPRAGARSDASMSNPKSRDILYADLSPAVGSEQGDTLSVLIGQKDTCNCRSLTVIAAVITSRLDG